ncbi:MAG: polysaccharide deacetylase family protein [Polyangiaceae bacterium]
MYSKNSIWFGPLVLTLAACSSSSEAVTGGSGGSSNSAGGAAAAGAAGAAGPLAGSGNNGGAAPTAGSGVGGADAGSAGAPPTAGSANGGSAGAAAAAGGGGGGGAGIAGGSSAGGAAGASAAGAGGGGSMPPAASGLPTPPGTANAPKPAGTPGAITVVNWAGFKGAVTYSFDDSNTSQIQNYAALQALAVPYTFYMWTGKSDASNSIWATALKDGHEIGNHTMSHDPGSHCTTADINSATDFIKTKLSAKAWTMAAPNGDKCYQPLSKGLFFINRGVGPAQPVMPNSNSDPSNLNCYIPATGQKASAFKSNVDDGRSKGGWVIYVVHGFTGDGSAYQPVPLAEMTAAISYTKSLGDMWIGSMVNVGAYFLGQKAFSSAMSTTAGTDKTWTWTLPGQFPTGKFLRVKVDGGTLKQKGVALTWDPHGYYEIALDAGSVTLSP